MAAVFELAPNRLTESLGEFCARYLLEEKWVVAPTYRIGYQWLETVTRGGRPVVNARVKTFPALAMELALPAMRQSGLTYAERTELGLLLEKLLGGLRVKRPYLLRLPPGPGLVSSLLRSLEDLRLAGLGPRDLHPKGFEVEVKGEELASILAAYEKALASWKIVDYAGVLRLALQAVSKNPSLFPGRVLVALPADMESRLRRLERELWESIPGANRMVLEVDVPHQPRHPESDASLLRWVRLPSEAPPPLCDGTVEMFRALGEVNEVREVLRRCLEKGISLDEVEVLHTDGEVYPPLFYEICSLLHREPDQEPPVTFSEGIPLRYTRPGRALEAWLSWWREGFPQQTLRRMIADGLLEIEELAGSGWSHSRLAALLAGLPIGAGRERYLPALENALASAHLAAADGSPPPEEEEGFESSSSFKEAALRILYELCRGLLSAIPSDTSDAWGCLRAVEDFIRSRARCTGRLDEYARLSLLDAVQRFSTFLEGRDASGIQILEWVEERLHSARVEGQGPRPGCLFVAPLTEGGHSGRPFTFIVGLDDGRFPGAVLQDPVLLDSERRSLSQNLETSAGRVDARLQDLALLLSRIRGRVTLSYSCLDLVDDREMFPSPALINCYRIVSGNRSGTCGDLLRYLPPPASFAPAREGPCLEAPDWWLSRLHGGEGALPEEEVGTAYPHLGRGMQARRARESDAFTPYDGHVPEAGRDLLPWETKGPVLSSRRLETLGKCPLEYFLSYVLEIRPPEEYLHRPTAWLDPAKRGDLLHSVFREFHVRLRTRGLRPSFHRDWEELKKILDEEIARWERLKPPPGRRVFEEEREDLLRTAMIFLREDEACCLERVPVYLELAVGMEGFPGGNEVDSPHPVGVELPGIGEVLLRGKIDRVDLLEGREGACFAVCDYKTGKNPGLDLKDPFKKGRHLQGYVYKVLAEKALSGKHPGAKVEFFEYFFASAREHGERVAWRGDRLEEGSAVLENLCRMLLEGCFPFTDNPDDVKYSDYRSAFGDREAAARAVKRKLANPANRALEPFRRLRGMEAGDG